MKQALFILLICSFTAAVFAESAGTMRLRLRWGGEETPAYGEVSCNSGPMTNLTPISMDAECPGGAWLVNGKAVISQGLPKKYNGFDVTVPWKPEGLLVVHLGTRPNGEGASRVEIPLKELVDGNKTFPISQEKTAFQCSVNRVAGDSLRVDLGKDNLVFAPRDVFQCTVRPNLLQNQTDPRTSAAGNGENPQQNQSGELEYVVFRGRETFELTRGTISNVDLNGLSAAQFQFPVPDQEGVYDLVLTLKRSRADAGRSDAHRLDSLKHPFRGKTNNLQLAERKIQFIVLADSAGNADGSVGTAGSEKITLKLEIDPSKPRWWEDFDRSVLRQFTSRFSDVQTLQNSQRQTRTAGNMNFLEIPQSQTPETAPNWEAFPLIIENPDSPHILEIEYLANVEQKFSVSIFEPNSAGAISPPGIDSGVNVPAPLGTAESAVFRLDRHHILFWPKSKTPIVLLVNRHEKKPVCIGKMRLYDAGAHLAPVKAGNSALAGDQTGNAAGKIKRRQTALLLDKPMFSHAFSSSEMNNAQTGLCISDWLTFYEGGRRMIEYMEHVGFNTLVLSIYTDGSTIYPSRILDPTPRFDNGMYFLTGQDPVRKDIVEMLLRQFDRKNLTLIPALDFSSPIPSLEVLARFSGAGTGGTTADSIPKRWLNSAGKELCEEKASLKNGAQYYNILNPVVQETILKSIAEVVHRYGHHPSFGGISLQLHANSVLVLPNSQWGMDPQSIALFAQETGRVLPQNFAEQVQFLSSESGAREWLAWRAGRMTHFYRRAASLLSSIQDAKLYLNGTDLFSLDAHPELLPRLDGICPAQDALLFFGLDVPRLKTIPNLVLSRPQKIVTNRSLAEQAGDLQWAQTPGTFRLFQDQNITSAVFYHAPEVLRLESFDKASPFTPTFTWMASTYAQTTTEARRPYAETLAMLDAFMIIEGGWNPAFGKEEALRGTLRMLSQLPAVHFNSAMTSGMTVLKSQPVIFRFCSLQGMNYAYAVNVTPFPVNARVYLQPSLNQQAGAGNQLANSLPGQVERLENGTYTPLGRDERGIFWRVQLAPYQIEAVRFAGSPFMMLDPETEVPPDAQVVFQSEFLRLQSFIESLKKPTFYLGMRNPGFESQAMNGEPVPYWSVTFPAPQTQIIPVSSTGGTSTGQFTRFSEGEAGTQEAGAKLDAADGPQFGENSLRLFSSGKPVRIMSQPFTVNPTGRLTVLLWLKTQENGSALPLRLILEGKTKNGNFYRSANFTGREALPGRGWEQVTIQMNDLPLEKDAQLSLGFELYGPGNVWIDNIQLTTVHFSETEISQLQGIFSRFGERIAKNEIAPCVSTLECYWMRFLKENASANTPPDTNPLAVKNSPQNSPELENETEKTGAQRPHFGSRPNLPPLPKLPAPPKLPSFQKNTPSEDEDDDDDEKEKKDSYLKKMKNLLPW
ncbi:MAG: family 10 glycosylhydrolase [Thermoguttaceae bacterium]|nr:family 10 glycosylhydrolase [Thermoguttaceae bacterium]